MSTIPTGDKYDQVIGVLLRSGIGYSQSPEFAALKGIADDLPGVVAAAYARFVSRQLQSIQSVEAARNALAPLNEIASWRDSRVDELLRTEVFEQFTLSKTDERIGKSMSNRLRSMYSEWSERENGLR